MNRVKGSLGGKICFFTDGVCWLDDTLHFYICGSGGMSTARPELPYPCISKEKSWVKTFQRGKLCDDEVSHV